MGLMGGTSLKGWASGRDMTFITFVALVLPALVFIASSFAVSGIGGYFILAGSCSGSPTNANCNQYNLNQTGCEQDTNHTSQCWWRSGDCTGTHNSCSGRSSPDCENHGCSYHSEGNCEGSHSNCDTYDGSESGCGDHSCTQYYSCSDGSHQGCDTWDGDGNEGTCTGHGCSNTAGYCGGSSGGCTSSPDCQGCTSSGDCTTCGESWTASDCYGDPHSCTAHNGDKATCDSVGCTSAFSDCSGSPHACSSHNGDSENCGGAGCTYYGSNTCDSSPHSCISHNGDQSTCETEGCTYYVGNCTGTLTCVAQTTSAACGGIENCVWSAGAVDTDAPQIDFVSPTTANGSVLLSVSSAPYLNLSTNDTNEHYSFVDLNSSLLLWLTMDQVNTTGDPVDISTYWRNVTHKGGAAISSSGKYNSSFALDGDGDYIGVPCSGFASGAGNFSLFAWIKTSSSGAFNTIAALGTASNSNRLYFEVNSGNLRASLHGGDWITSSGAVNDNAWHDVGVIYNSTELSIYIDGSLSGTAARSPSLACGTFNIGYDDNSNTYFNGNIDDVLFFNRTLNLSEIRALNNSKTSRYFNNFTAALADGNYTYRGHVVDISANRNQTGLYGFLYNAVPPSVSIDNTSGLTFSYRASIAVQGTCSGDAGSGLAYAWTNSTYFTGLDSSPTIFNFTNTSGVPDGNTTIYVFCNDSYGKNSSAAFNFLLDTVAPTVDFVAPTTANGSVTTNTSAYVNLTTTDAGLHYAFSDFNSSLVLWYTMDSVSGSTLTDRGPHALDGAIKDGASQNESGRFGKSFFFDGTDDDIIGINNCSSAGLPLKGAGNWSIFMWIKTTGASGDLLTLGNTGTTSQGLFFYLSSGKIKLDLPNVGGTASGTAVNDGNWHHVGVIYNGSRVVTYVDTKWNSSSSMSPNIQCTNYRFNISENTGHGQFGGNIDDLIIFNRSLSSGEIAALYNATSTQYERNFSGLSDGNYTFRGYVVDSAGNINQTGKSNIYVDNIAPFVWAFSPNASYFNTTSLNLRYIATDAGGVGTVWLNYSGYSTNASLSGNTTITSAEGKHKFMLYANDTSGNINVSGSGNGFDAWVDTQPPNTTIDNTTGLFLPYRQSIAVQGTCADSGIAGVNYSYTNSSYFAGVDSTPSIFNLTNTSGIPDGAVTVYVFCNDSAANNLNFSKFAFTLDSTSPVASVSSPADGYYGSAQSVAGTCTDTNLNTSYTNSTYYSGVDETPAAFSFANTSSLADGRIALKVYCNDSANNTAASSSVLYWLDTTPPFPHIFSPNATYYNVTTLNLREIASDAIQLNKTWYQYNGVNYTLTNGANTTFTGNESTNTLYLWANDSAGNYNFSSFSVSVDTQPPNTTVDNATGSVVGGAAITIQGRCTDSGVAGLHSAYTNSSYFAGIDTSPEIFNLTNTSAIPDGAVTVYVFCNDSAGNNLNFSRLAFTVDITPPAFSSVGSIPNAALTDYIDPFLNITITANITDAYSRIDNATLQWKNYSGATWTNVTMANTTAKGTTTSFNATLPLPWYEANMTYRIVTNDTLGNGDTSANTTLNSFWDCTWNITDRDFGSVSGYNENKRIGNITINNTGDLNYTSGSNCTLKFRIRHNLAEERIYYNDSNVNPSDSFDVTAGQIANTLINMTFYSTVREDAVSMNVTDYYLRSATANITVATTLISTTGGAYLLQAITVYPASVNLTPQNFTLTSYLRNIAGDDTAAKAAYNVSFNWTLPSGWLVRDGNTSFWLDNITNSSLIYSSINVSFNSSNLPSMPAGNYTITVSAAAANSTAGAVLNALGQGLHTKTGALTQLCYGIADNITISSCGSLDGDYVAPATTTTTTTTEGGGVLGGSALTKTQAEALMRTSESAYDVVRGSDNSFTITITNPLNQPLTNVTIALAGFLASRLSLGESFIAELAPGESREITVRIDAPKYLAAGKNDLTFTISGKTKVRGIAASFKETKAVSLYVQEIPKSDAESFIGMTEGLVAKFNSLGFPTAGAESLLEQARYQLASARDYAAVMETAQQAEKLLDDAISADSEIKSNNGMIAQAAKDGLPTPKTTRLNNLASAAFQRGEFALAKARADEAAMAYALETKGEFNLGMFLINNWTQVSLSSGIALIAFLFLFFRLKLSLVKHRLKVLDKEESVLLGLIKQVQKDCFEKAKMSMEEYMHAVLEYEARLGKAVQKRIELETKRIEFSRWWGKSRALYQERDKLLQLMKQTQSDYMEKGTIETHVYGNRMKSLKERLSTVEEKISFMEAKAAIRKKMGRKALKFFR